MRIGIDAVPFAYDYTGTVRYLSGMLDGILEADPTVELLLYSPMPIEPPLRQGNWRVRHVPDRLFRRPVVWVQYVLPHALRADRVDVFWAQPANLPLRLRRSCFRLLTVHDLVYRVCPSSMRFRTWLRMRSQLTVMARTADVVLADSAATAALVRRHLGVKRSSLHVVYAAAQGCFRQVPTEEARRVADQVFGLRQKYILCVSTIEPRKEHLTLLRAVAHTPGVPLLVLVGGLGWRCRSVLGQIRVHERAGRVKYLGRVDEKWLPGLYSAATLSVYPSLYEGFGLPVLESMACGCPVVCSDSSSLPEVGGSAVRCFRTGDHADLARVLTGLLRDDGLLKRMSAAGLRRAEQFSFRTAGRQILGLIRQGVGRIGRPRDESAISLAADTTHQAGAVERAQVIA